MKIIHVHKKIKILKHMIATIDTSPTIQLNTIKLIKKIIDTLFGIVVTYNSFLFSMNLQF